MLLSQKETAEAETMPIYEYECEKCQEAFEISQKISEPPLTECPTCGSPVRKLVSRSSFQLKGGGWYKTDYKKPGSSSGGSSGGTKSETASATPAPEKPKPKGGCGSGGCGHSH